MIDPAVAEVLWQVSEVMADAHDDWCFVGGVAALLHGVPVSPLDDIDVLLSAADAERVLPRHGIAPTPDGGTERFRSRVFSRCHRWAVQVDFLAGFEVRSGADWVPILVGSISRVALGQLVLPVASVKDLVAMHALFGRPKDTRRVRDLRALATT